MSQDTDIRSFVLEREDVPALAVENDDLQVLVLQDHTVESPKTEIGQHRGL